jgi:hypothetical protein
MEANCKAPVGMLSHRHAANAIVENRESTIIRKIAFRVSLTHHNVTQRCDVSAAA